MDALSFIFSNSNSSERKLLREMSEMEQKNQAGHLVSQLYDSLLNKSYAKFDAIEKSKGNIEKYEGYDTMVTTLEAMRKMIESSRISLPKEWSIVNQSIQHLKRLTPVFETSFKLERKFGILTYNTIAAACVESTSLLLISVIEFVKQPSMGEVVMVKQMTETGYLPIVQLNNFNQAVESGEFMKAMNIVNTTDKEKLVGGMVAVPFIVIGAIIGIVVILRELTFYYYYTRMNLSAYLDHQKEFLEYNIKAVELSKEIDPAKKKEIIKKQEKTARSIEKLSDKIRVNHQASATQAKIQLDKEKQQYSLSAIQHNSRSTGSTSNGFVVL